MPRKGEVTPVASNPLRSSLPLFSLSLLPPPRRAAPFPKVTTLNPSSPKVPPVADFTQGLGYYITACYRKPQSWMGVPFLKVLWPIWPSKILFGSFFYMSSCLISLSCGQDPPLPCSKFLFISSAELFKFLSPSSSSLVCLDGPFSRQNGPLRWCVS